MADEKKRPQITRGRDVKKRKTYLLPLGPGVVFRMRRVDIPSLFMEGIIPTPLLASIDRLESVRQRAGMTNTVAGLGEIHKEDLANFNEAIRRAAVLAVISPKLTHSKKASLADPDLVWVGGYSDLPDEAGKPEEEGDINNTDLMIIWRAMCGEAGIVTLTDDEADEFRSHESHVDDPVVRDGVGVRPEAVVVVPSAGDPETQPKKVRIFHH